MRVRDIESIKRKVAKYNIKSVMPCLCGECASLFELCTSNQWNQIQNDIEKIDENTRAWDSAGRDAARSNYFSNLGVKS